VIDHFGNAKKDFKIYYTTDPESRMPAKNKFNFPSSTKLNSRENFFL